MNPNNTFYVTFARNGNGKTSDKFEKIELSGPLSLSSFKNQVYKKYNLFAADFYFLDEGNVYHLVNDEKEFISLMDNVHSLRFFVDVSGVGFEQDLPCNFKFDTRNLKINNEFQDLKNDKKPRNALVNFKKEKSKIKAKLRELCSTGKCDKGCPCEKNQNIICLQNAMKEYKYFQVNRLKKKFWKTSRKDKIRDENMGIVY